MKGLIFTYALAYGGSVVSLFNPFYGLLIYICFAIIKPEALWHWSVPAGNYSRIIGIAFLTGWAIHGFGDRQLGRARPIVIALMGYYLWVILSTLFSPQPELGLPFVEYLAKIVFPFVAGITLVRDWDQFKLLLWVIMGSCAYLAYEINLAYLSGANIAGNGFLFLDNNSISILMVTSFGLALVLGFEERVLWRRGLFFGIAAAMAHVPMLSMSRGGMTGALAAGLVAAAVVPKTRRTWTMIVAAVVAGLILAGPSVVARYSTTFNEEDARDASAQSRLDLWRDCTDAMLKNPLFGIGQEHWGLVAPSYGWPSGKEAHSLWFQTAAELGIPGVAFLLLFYCLVLAGAWRATRRVDDPWIQTLGRMILVSVVGFAVSASFVTVEGFELPYYVALLSACCVKLAHKSAGELPVFADEAGETISLDGVPLAMASRN